MIDDTCKENLVIHIELTLKKYCKYSDHNYSLGS